MINIDSINFLALNVYICYNTKFAEMTFHKL